MLTVRKKIGFTLVELLVVITIIALLLAVMIPALGEAKKIARSVICKSNLHQWGVIFSLYAHDNENSLPQSENNLDEGGISDNEAYWPGATLRYYEDKKIRFCPSTKVVGRNPTDPYLVGGVFVSWGPFEPGRDQDWWTKFDSGSYGLNDWCADPAKKTYWGEKRSNAWQKMAEGAGHRVPLFGDCAYTDGFVENGDVPLLDPDDPRLVDRFDPTWATWSKQSIRLFALPRHRKKANMAFLDMSAKSVRVKEYWEFKWSKDYDINYMTLSGFPWPVWMEGL